ncbi:MAG: GNAT family N-acetyltransferase [bacterium]
MVDIQKVTTDSEFKQVLKLRFEVFVDEQGVPPEIERDEADDRALHIMACQKKQVVGCGRVEFKENEAKIGRLAVKKRYRDQGIGTKICQRLIKEVTKKGYQKIVLHAQVESADFYKKLGFMPVGDKFMEAGIEHVKMVGQF